MRMKKLLFICLLVLCCACEEDRSVDPTLMPPATTMGKNTFGCLVDGWVYTSGRWGMPTATVYKEDEDRNIKIEAPVGMFSSMSILLINPQHKATCVYRCGTEDGEAYITRMDGTVISGTFGGGTISEGRFDVTYEEERGDGGGVY